LQYVAVLFEGGKKDSHIDSFYDDPEIQKLVDPTLQNGFLLHVSILSNE